MPNNIATVRKERKKLKTLVNYFKNRFGTGESTTTIEKNQNDMLDVIVKENLEAELLANKDVTIK